MVDIRIKVRRTLGELPPSDLQFAELAYAAGSDSLFVGRPDGSAYPLSQPPLPELATVALSGDYADLTNKPYIPTLPTLATVATSGSYNDLENLPTIPILPALGSASAANIEDFATAAQGAKADTALQASSLNWLGSASAANIEDFATAAQGALAVTALQPASNLSWGKLTGLPTTLAGYGITDAATAAQGAKADTALQPASNLSWGKLTGLPTTLAGYGITDAATAAQGAKADTALQPASNLSWGKLTGLPTTLAGYGITDAATAAQGAKADTAVQTANFTWTNLGGKPTLAFSYVQQSEPTSPSTGATWLELTGTGDVAGEWVWSGSVWLSIQRFSFGTHSATYSGSGAPPLTGGMIPIFNNKIFIEKLLFTHSVATADATNYWTLDLRVFNIANGVQISATSFSIKAPSSNTDQLFTSILYSTGTFTYGFALGVLKVGTPANISISVRGLARYVR